MTTQRLRTPILAVVVDTYTANTLADLLQGTSFVVTFAATIDDALEKAESLLPAAILLDLDLKTLNSYELCRQVRANRLLAHLPVLMLVTRSDRDARAIGLSAGADDFISKPFDGIEVLARLQTIARLNTYRQLLSDLKRFAWMVEYAQEGYLIIDQAAAIQYANEQAMLLLNLPEDYAGLPFIRVVEQQYVPEPEAVWNYWMKDPEPCFLVQPESPTARAVWMVLEALDTPLGVDYQRIVRLRDVTERMSIYQDMRRFHTVVAHKLRTPMSIMVGNLGLIKNKMDMMSPEDVKEFMRTAIGGADRLANEIRTILTYIDAPLALNLGKPMLLKQMPDLINGIVDSLELKNVNLSLPADLGETIISMTPDAMEAVLQELLENARKFHPEHAPTVDISVGQTDPSHISMRVVDDGVSLSIEQRKWAWLPYVQGEKDFSGELPGMGLGFPMVATLIWKAGGSLHLRNRADRPGVIVEMKIPLESTMRQLEISAKPYGEA